MIMLQCAVGVILDVNNRILIAKRALHQSGGGLWEFPGGKIEPNESSEEALIRELQEEIGIIPTHMEELIQFSFSYPHNTVQLHAFCVYTYVGEIYGREGQPLVWVYPHELPQYPLLQANQIIVDALLKKSQELNK